MKTSLFRPCIALFLVCAFLFVGCISDKPRSPDKGLLAAPPPSYSPPKAPVIPHAETPTPQESANAWDVSDLSLSHIDPARKLIAFTFDDAPARTLENILAVFAAFNENNPDCKASGTLFVNGKRAENYSPVLLSTAYAMGFELGNHTHSHYDLTTLDEQTLQEEIQKTDDILARIDGKPRHLFRAPFGKTNERVKQAVFTPLIDWTIDTLDWTGIPADDVYNAVFAQRFSGAIVLMHDGYPNTVTALKRLLPDLKADGYQVVSVSLLAKAHGCVLERGKTYIRARKQKK